MASAEKKKALELALGQIEKQFGKGAIMKLGESQSMMDVDIISTGCLDLDLALGVGGLPRGRILELYGPESSGKTTVALHVVAEAQKAGGTAAFVDAEHALDPVYARNLGVNIVDALVRSSAVDVIVVDSGAALVPKAEIAGDMGDAHVGLQARLMAQALRKLAGAVSKSNTVILFINQLREKVGVMFGNPETTPGGRALKFYATIRMDIRRTDSIKQGTDIIGNRTRVKVVKNKVAPPFKTAEFDVLYGEGISREGCILDRAVDQGLIVKSGAWFSYNGDRIGQGRENARKYLKENPEVTNLVDQKIRELVLGKGKADEAAQPETPEPQAES